MALTGWGIVTTRLSATNKARLATVDAERADQVGAQSTTAVIE